MRSTNTPRFVKVRGTMISTNRCNPSMLSIAVVQTLGMPNKEGVLIVENRILNVTYLDDHRISVWADIDSTVTTSTHYMGWLEACAVM